jgi:hypothetical protein
MQPGAQLTAQGAVAGQVASSLAGSHSLPLRDHASRMFVLGRLVASFDEGDQFTLSELLSCGFSPELVDRLRGMSMVDALRFTSDACGLTISVDARAMQARLAALQQFRADRELYESFIRAGASPHLVSRLFGVNAVDVRRLRRLIAPECAVGGRPRTAPEDLREQISAAWKGLGEVELSERQRYWLLHLEFSDLPMAALEAVVAGNPSQGSAAQRASARAS